MYPVSLCLFMCKEKRCKSGAGESGGRVYHEVYFDERIFYISAKSHEDVHGHVRPNLSTRTPSKLRRGFPYSSNVK